MNDDLAAAVASLIDVWTRPATTESERTALLEQLRQHDGLREADLAQLQQSRQTLAGSIEQQDAALAEARKRAQALDGEIAALNARLRERAAYEQQLRAQLTERQRQIDAREAEIERLRREAGL
jgi:chromosome segregation ATPase